MSQRIRALSAQNISCLGRTIISLPGEGGGEINIVLHAKNLFFPFCSNKQFRWGFTYNLFRFIALENNSFQSFWFCKQFISTFSVPHPTCKQYIVYIRLALTARTFRMKFVCEMLPYCCIKAQNQIYWDDCRLRKTLIF